MKEGRYTLQKNSFLIEGKKYLIKDRKKETTKPKKYLIALQPFHYISSLFPVPGEHGSYRFDIESKLYKLQQEEDVIKIEAL